MGKRSRNREPEIAPEESVEEQIARAEREYRGLKRMMTIGAVGVAILILGLILRQPGGWVGAVVVLAVIEGVSYPLLLRSLGRRRAERIARIQSGE